jgi:hypothetical protein
MTTVIENMPPSVKNINSIRITTTTRLNEDNWRLWSAEMQLILQREGVLHIVEHGPRRFDEARYNASCTTWDPCDNYAKFLITLNIESDWHTIFTKDSHTSHEMWKSLELYSEEITREKFLFSG